MPYEFNKELDLLIIPGGADMNPTRGYVRNEPYSSLSFLQGNIDPFIEYFRHYLLDIYIDKGIPIVGICLGHQILGSRFGSKLMPHITNHTEGLHTIKAGKDELKVNTSHHQAILELGKDLEEIAYSVNAEGRKDCIEAFKHKTLPICGVNIVRHSIVIWN